MICAYDKSYLAAAQKNLARMLDYLVNDLHYPLETAWQWFLISKVAFRFEQGDCSVLVGLSGVELARAVLEQAGEVVPMQKPSYAYDRSPEYWTGWILAFLQWRLGESFEDLLHVVPHNRSRRSRSSRRGCSLRPQGNRRDMSYSAHNPLTLGSFKSTLPAIKSLMSMPSESNPLTVSKYLRRAFCSRSKRLG